MLKPQPINMAEIPITWC